MKTGVELIAEERQRQIEIKGYAPLADQQYPDGALALAAAAYAIPEKNRIKRIDMDVWHLWPWIGVHWKPTPENRIRELQKAGALIAAEIDRLQAEIEEKL